MNLQLPPPPDAIIPNPGGRLDPTHIVGRDEAIYHYWALLQNQSLILLGPRRLGKTSICRRMQQWPPPGFEPRHFNLEGKTQVTDFVQMLFDDISALLTRHRVVLHRAHQILHNLTGSIEVKGFKLALKAGDWRQFLEAIFDDLQAYTEARDCHVVLFWDELPLFIRDVYRGGQQREAMALLDHLRAARQRHDRIRMVFTGSIGLHEVIDELRRGGYGNDPTNDMAKELVDALSPDGARTLARVLLKGVGGEGDERVVTRVASLCESHPFLIQHLVLRLQHRKSFQLESVDSAFASLMEQTTDILGLLHYLRRLEHYFSGEDVRLAMKLLDFIAMSETPLTHRELREAFSDTAPEDILKMVNTLFRDLYLRRSDGKFSFRYVFLRRFWCLERGL